MYLEKFACLPAEVERRMQAEQAMGCVPSRPPLAPGMDAVHLGVPFVATCVAEISRLGVSKVFVMANRSCAGAAQPLLDALGQQLVGPLYTGIVMGGAEEGVLEACDKARTAGADCVITLGGGAVHDAGKLVRMWLTAETADRASVAGIQAAAGRTEMPPLPPQIAAPNSFAMAELTHVAGLTTTDGVKSGAAHPAMMPTVVVFDPSLAQGLPDWVLFGTALRGVEHAVGAACSPAANDDIRKQAINGLVLTTRGLRAMLKDPCSSPGQVDCYLGGWHSIRAINTGCYPALGHFLQNHYSAKYNVHQGSCSGILMARIMAYHAPTTASMQAKIAQALGEPGLSAPQAVTKLVAALPGVAKDHQDAGVDASTLPEWTASVFERFGDRINKMSPHPFEDAEALLAMMTRPISELS